MSASKVTAQRLERAKSRAADAKPPVPETQTLMDKVNQLRTHFGMAEDQPAPAVIGTAIERLALHGLEGANLVVKADACIAALASMAVATAQAPPMVTTTCGRCLPTSPRSRPSARCTATRTARTCQQTETIMMGVLVGRIARATNQNIFAGP